MECTVYFYQSDGNEIQVYQKKLEISSFRLIILSFDLVEYLVIYREFEMGNYYWDDTE